MQSKITILATSLVLLVSGSSALAKPPAKESCEVLLPSAINAGQPYSVKVVRVPRYPGGWFRPTINIDVSYPTTPGNAIGDSREQTFLKYSVTYATATFTVPEAFDAETSEAVIVSGGMAEVTATVKEPINKKKFKETVCTASTMVY
jgi:hypothetical protein